MRSILRIIWRIFDLRCIECGRGLLLTETGLTCNRCKH